MTAPRATITNPSNSPRVLCFVPFQQPNKPNDENQLGNLKSKVPADGNTPPVTTDEGGKAAAQVRQRARGDGAGWAG